MTAFFGKSAIDWRRRLAVVIVLSLSLKVVLLAFGPALADGTRDAGPAETGRDLLAALHVICTPEGAGTLPPAGDGETDNLDCLRCCGAVSATAQMVGGPLLTLPVAYRVGVTIPKGAEAATVAASPARPRAPPVSIPV